MVLYHFYLIIYFFISANTFAHFLFPSLAKPLCLKIIENAFPKLNTSWFCNTTLRHLVRCKGYLFFAKKLHPFVWCYKLNWILSTATGFFMVLSNILQTNFMVVNQAFCFIVLQLNVVLNICLNTEWILAYWSNRIYW